MPARTVRCLFSNQTEFPIVYESDDLSHGEYTGSWLPPQQVKPGEIGEWRSESDGIMTGTEGPAKSIINVPDSMVGHKEFIDIWWDNPYVGTNSADLKVTNDFGGTPSTDIREGHFIQSGGPPPNAMKVADTDVEAWLDTFLFPP